MGTRCDEVLTLENIDAYAYACRGRCLTKEYLIKINVFAAYILGIQRIVLFIVNEKAGTLNAKQAVVPIIYKPLKLMAKLKMLESKQVN